MGKPPPFTALELRLAAEARKQQRRDERLAARGPQPCPDDVYSVPTPLPGPSTWVVTNARDGEVTLCAADTRPLNTGGDLCVGDQETELWLRLSASAQVSANKLSSLHRIDVCAGAAAQVHAWAATRSPNSPHPEATDGGIARWRQESLRAARVLSRWLSGRVLLLGVRRDLLDAVDGEFSSGATDSSAEPANIRLVAAPSPVVASFARVWDATRAPMRWTEIDCAGGRLVLVVASHGIGFLFEPFDDAPPPRMQWTMPSADASGNTWLASASGAARRCFVQHDWQSGPASVCLLTTNPFSIMVDAEGFWT